MDTKTDQKQLAFEAEVAAYFTAAKLENVSRLTPQQFASFSKEATAVLCEKNPYLKRVPLADCQAYMNDALFNIRMAMRHYQALKIAAAHGDFRTPAVIPSALGIDDPRYDFDPRSTLATERGRIPVCSESSWRPTRDSLLRELCAGQSVLIASSISQGLETAVLDANKRPTNQWKPIAAKKPKNDPTMTLASHATTIVGFDPQNGGYFLIRNSSGGDAVAYLRLPVNQVCHVTEAIAFTRVPPKFRADLPAPRDRRGLDH